jgi:hypothetical protein
MVEALGLLFLGIMLLYIIKDMQVKDHYVNDKGQKIAYPRSKGVLFYNGECKDGKHFMPIYNNGSSVGIGDSNEKCQCGEITVGEHHARIVADMFDPRTGKIPLDSDEDFDDYVSKL